MKTLKQHWTKFILLSAAGLALILITVSLAFGQTAPALKITVTPTNQVSLTVINGIPTGIYHIYFTPFLGDPDYPWTLLANGTTGQTNFTFSASDYDQIFFKAINNSNFVAPSVTLLIQSPANGSTVN